jgi:septal ring factor EnvC (AmiA/AmiB activator)
LGVRAGISLLAGWLIVLAGGVLAQPRPPDLDALKQRDQELDALRADQRKTSDGARKLEDEIETVGADRRRLNQTLIDTAGRMRAVEERIAATEARLGPLDDKEHALRGSLEARRGTIAEVLAALQRIGRRPPPAVLVRPEDALESLRTAIMLGAVLPDMRHEAEVLAADLASLAAVRKEIASEREALTRDVAAMSDERRRLTALIGERQRQQAAMEQSLDAQRARAAALGRQADNLKDLIARLEQGLDPATRAARAAARATEDGKVNLAALSDPGRMTPAVSFAAAKGTLKLPANGVKVRDFGAADGIGGTEKGMSIATRPGAQLTAPCDAWVVYAAPYRSYGQLLILNAGGGYHLLLAGMETYSVDVGQFVLTGEPIAVMGNGPQVASAIVAGSTQPVLYIEFRKDGIPIDPAPWWAMTVNEKVRG